jgi:hypothetical protein
VIISALGSRFPGLISEGKIMSDVLSGENFYLYYNVVLTSFVIFLKKFKLISYDEELLAQRQPLSCRITS